MADRYNWSEIRARYVEGTALDPDGDPTRRSWPSLTDVAAETGIGMTAIKRHARDEHWTEQRAAHQSELERNRRAALIAQRVEQATKVDAQGLTVAEAGMALVGVRLTHLVNRETGNGAERGARIDGGELAALGLAARRWLQVKAAVMGQPEDLAPTADEVERQFQIDEAMTAARLAEHLAARAREVVDDESTVAV